MAAQLLLPLERGDTILVLASPCLYLVKILFSCQRAGLLSVPISPPQLLPHQSIINKDFHHLIRVLHQTKPNAAIGQRSYITNIHQYLANSQVDAQFSALLKGIKWLVMEDFDNQNGRTLNNINGYSGCGADDVYLIQYTSWGTQC